MSTIKWLKEDVKQTCKECKNEFLKKQITQIYCSLKCRNRFNGHKSEFSGIPTGTVGAIQELKVSSDLLSKGYEVFRALSPSCSCDLLILKDGKLKRIEVRTAYKTKNGEFYYPDSKLRARLKADILALVVNGEIKYEPEHP